MVVKEYYKWQVGSGADLIIYKSIGCYPKDWVEEGYPRLSDHFIEDNKLNLLLFINEEVIDWKRKPINRNQSIMKMLKRLDRL